MLKEYRAAAVHRAGQFSAGMAPADVEMLVDEINRGRDPARDAVCVFNGAAIFITKPGAAALTASPGNWIVMSPDGTLGIHADADFCSAYCAAAS
jgi:hypothetical protein